jgi:hemerythrin superfamily protein
MRTQETIRSMRNHPMSDTIYDVLKKDHKLLKQWLKELETEIAASEAKGIGPADTPTFDIFSNYLTAHSKAEEKVFYDRLKVDEETEESALEGEVEHSAADKLLKELQSMERGSKDWNARFIVLKEMLEHHIEEEESVLFKKAKDVLEKDEEKRLGQQMEQQRGQIPDIQKRVRGASLAGESRLHS